LVLPSNQKPSSNHDPWLNIVPLLD
jgi:hypothetical protein